MRLSNLCPIQFLGNDSADLALLDEFKSTQEGVAEEIWAGFGDAEQVDANEALGIAKEVDSIEGEHGEDLGDGGEEAQDGRAVGKTSDTDGDKASGRAEQFDASLELRASHGIQDEIQASFLGIRDSQDAANLVCEVGGDVVDAVIRTELIFQKGQFCLSRGGHEDRATRILGHLHSDLAHASRGSVNEHAVSREESASEEEAVVGGGQVHGKRGSLGKGHSLRQGRHCLVPRRCKLRVSSKQREGNALVSFLHRKAFLHCSSSNSQDNSGDLISRHEWVSGSVWVEPSAAKNVGIVETEGVDLDKDLIVLNGGLLDPPDDHFVGLAMREQRNSVAWVWASLVTAHCVVCGLQRFAVVV